VNRQFQNIVPQSLVSEEELRTKRQTALLCQVGFAALTVAANFPRITVTEALGSV
jgi:hypothetical protein